MAQLTIQHIAHIPSKSRNHYTGSNRFEEGFHLYRLTSVERNAVGFLIEKVVIFRASLDYKQFASHGNPRSYSSVQALLEGENTKAELYKNQLKTSMPIGVYSFSPQEMESAHQIWNEIAVS